MQEKRTTNISIDDTNIVGNSEPIQWLKSFIRKIAPLNSNVIISGETGTGKELVAHAIHRMSASAAGPYIPVNCAAIPENLLESELFGFEKGAFTGAYHRLPGKFEQAKNGTIVLDEIGEMPLSIQAKLLRVVENKTIDKLGSPKPVKLDFRIIASTNQNLLERVRQRKFREDLYHRLNVAFLHVPPLRDRLEDLQPLTDFFIANISRTQGLQINDISKEAIQMLISHTWPGNVRELANVLERAAITSQRNKIQAADIQAAMISPFHSTASGRNSNIDQAVSAFGTQSLKYIMHDIEKNIIIKALIEAEGKQTEAAKLLGLGRKNLWKKLQKHSISTRAFRQIENKSELETAANPKRAVG